VSADTFDSPLLTHRAFLPVVSRPGVIPTLPGQLCPASVHDTYVTTGPDGKKYPTWHPQIDPATKCYFDHEHGDDPRTSLANSTMPAFGYVGGVAGMAEAHGGFKVFVANAGTVNDEGRKALTSTRIVAHMGTGGVKRYTEGMHSLQFDLAKSDGHYVHVQGMADTGDVGSICQRDANPGKIGRTVVIVKGAGCNVGSLYEVWLFKLAIGDKLLVHGSTAVFDPVTVMNPANKSQLILARDVYPNFGEQHGCDREAYHGPVYWYNRFGSTVYNTDAFGKIVNGGPIRQEISKHDAIGIPMTSDQTLFKFRKSTCVKGLGLLN
jgi:hypothetical protein